MGNLKTRHKGILDAVSTKESNQEILKAMNKIVGMLSDINDGFNKLSVKVDSLSNTRDIVVQYDNPIIPDNIGREIKESHRVEQSFIPTIDISDMVVKSDAVTTKSKKRNLSGAADNLKNVNRGENNG